MVRIGVAGEINDVLMRVRAGGPTRDRPGTRYGDIGNVDDWIGKDINDREIAILATIAAFNPDWAGRRQTDIECPGTPVDFSGNSTKKRGVSRTAGVTHQSVTTVTRDVVSVVLGFLSGIGPEKVCPNVQRRESRAGDIFRTAAVNPAEFEIRNSDRDQTGCHVVRAAVGIAKSGRGICLWIWICRI